MQIVMQATKLQKESRQRWRKINLNESVCHLGYYKETGETSLGPTRSYQINFVQI
jgi:hypothetical protein